MRGAVSPELEAQRAARAHWGVQTSTDKCSHREFALTRVGADVDCAAGTARAPIDKIRTFSHMVLLALSRRGVTPRALQVILGRAVRMAEFRRPIMGVLNRI